MRLEPKPGLGASLKAVRPESADSEVAILTGGGDRPYALGLAFSLLREEVRFDFIGSDFLEAREMRESPFVSVLNLRGDVGPQATPTRKIVRVLIYYLRLLGYTARAKPRIFHILWNNKLEIFDRTLLLIYYRLFGKRLVLTVHNVNIRKRDGNDGLLNRLTLRAQYRLAHHLFVHTELMKRELQADFGVRDTKISVIPFGINNTVPITPLTRAEARKQFGLDSSQPTLLFFGNIAAYKGLEYLVDAMEEVAEALPHVRLIIAGRPKGAEAYWARIEQRISSTRLNNFVIRRIEYVPDEHIEIYFKAADVLLLPYVHVFQSGVLFLGYNFGLPVIASDVGALKEEIIEGQTGFVCAAQDTGALATTIKRYFASEMYRALESRRCAIQAFAAEQYSWSKVASITVGVYRSLLSTSQLLRGRKA